MGIAFDSAKKMVEWNLCQFLVFLQFSACSCASARRNVRFPQGREEHPIHQCAVVAAARAVGSGLNRTCCLWLRHLHRLSGLRESLARRLRLGNCNGVRTGRRCGDLGQHIHAIICSLVDSIVLCSSRKNARDLVSNSSCRRLLFHVSCLFCCLV